MERSVPQGGPPDECEATLPCTPAGRRQGRPAPDAYNHGHDQSIDRSRLVPPRPAAGRQSRVAGRAAHRPASGLRLRARARRGSAVGAGCGHALVAASFAGRAGCRPARARCAPRDPPGPTATTIEALCTEAGATHVFWNRLYDPALTARDSTLKPRWRAAGLEADSFKAHVLFEPWESLPARAIRTACSRRSGAMRARGSMRSIRRVRPRAFPGRGAFERVARFARAAAEDPLGHRVPRPLAAGRSGSARTARRLHRRRAGGLRRRPRPAGPRRHLAAVAAPALRRDLAAPHPARARRARRASAGRRLRARTGLAGVRPPPAVPFPRTTEHPLNPQFADFPWADDDQGL